METVESYQEKLANVVIPNMSFKFNSRPVANIKKGTMYNLQRFNSHTINGLEIENFKFFERAYGSNQSDKTGKCSLKGFAEIKNENVKKILVDKIKNGLREATSKDLFENDCDVVLRLNNLTTCSGGVDNRSIHNKCTQAKNIFERLKFVEISSNNAAEVTPCLYNNFVHSHKEYNKLRISHNPNSGQYTVCNNEYGTFVINETPKLHPDESIYSSHTNSLSGIINIRLTGVYLKDDDTVSNTIKLWGTILKTDLLTYISEISDTCLAPEEYLGPHDDVLWDDKENEY